MQKGANLIQVTPLVNQTANNQPRFRLAQFQNKCGKSATIQLVPKPKTARYGPFNQYGAFYIMPPMPGIPPPPSGAAGLSSGASATIASVVTIKPAIEPAA